MKEYEVLSRVEHDQKIYEPESSIELDDACAEPLLKIGSIKYAGDASGSAPQVGAPDAKSPKDGAAK